MAAKCQQQLRAVASKIARACRIVAGANTAAIGGYTETCQRPTSVGPSVSEKGPGPLQMPGEGQPPFQTKPIIGFGFFFDSLFVLSVDLFMPVKMQLSRIIISELTENQIIYLHEVDGDREFPILIGIFEATNIDRRVKEDYQPPRPLTHDLVVNVAKSLGAEIDSVVISELTDATYFAQLKLRKADGEMIEIDSRPSDAIAVAVTFSPPLPIYVSEHVLAEATSAIQ